MLSRRSENWRFMETKEMFLTPTFEFFPFQTVLIYFYRVFSSSSLLQAEVSYFI